MPQPNVPVPNDRFPPLDCIMDTLDRLPLAERAPAALIAAAQLVEYAAYEVAQTERSRSVARMILLAVDIERTASDLRAQDPSSA